MTVPGPLGQHDLPPMPALEPELLAAADVAYRDLSGALHEAHPSVLRLFKYVQWRILREAAASIEPPVPERPPQLVPPRRRHLSTPHQRRLEGCAIALRHLDTRVAMRHMGAIDRVVEPETPMVLHAFVEAEDAHGRDSNAGCVRATPTRFAEGDIGFIPPPPEHCRRLLLDAVETAYTAPAPLLTRATWLLSVVFAVHPFVDGNGRTGRLLFHAMVSESVPTGIDWGTISELAARRAEYIEATRRPLRPSLPDYDARRIEPVHLMAYLARVAAEGASRTNERLAAIAMHHDRLRAAGLDDDAAVVVGAVAADRNAQLCDLVDVHPDASELTEIVNGLLASGWLAWDRARNLQLVADNPFRTTWP